MFCGMKGHYMIDCDKYRSQLPSGRSEKESLKEKQLM